MSHKGFISLFTTAMGEVWINSRSRHLFTLYFITLLMFFVTCSKIVWTLYRRWSTVRRVCSWHSVRHPFNCKEENTQVYSILKTMFSNRHLPPSPSYQILCNTQKQIFFKDHFKVFKSFVMRCTWIWAMEWKLKALTL